MKLIRTFLFAMQENALFCLSVLEFSGVLTPPSLAVVVPWQFCGWGSWTPPSQICGSALMGRTDPVVMRLTCTCKYLYYLNSIVCLVIDTLCCQSKCLLSFDIRVIHYKMTYSFSINSTAEQGVEYNILCSS